MNVTKAFLAAAKRFGTKTFLVCNERNVSYIEFAGGIKFFQEFLYSRNIPKNEVLCITGNNTPEYLALSFAILGSGYRLTNLNPNLTPFEIVQRAAFVNAPLIFVQQNIFSPASWKEIEKAGISLSSFGEFPVSQAGTVTIYPGSGEAFIQFTGGTSGAFKAAIVSHENILGNSRQITAHLGTSVVPGEESALVTVPFYHTFSFVFNAVTMASIGATLILVENVRNVEMLLDAVEKYQPTLMVAVNTMYRRIMQHVKFSGSSFESLKICIGGGEKIQPETKRLWQKSTGKNIFEAYGLTETAAMLTCNPIDTSKNMIDCAGIPLPETSIQLLDENLAVINQVHQAGDIYAKGIQVSKKYYKNPEATKETFLNGWLKTGDIGEWEQGGYLRILDRSKDMVSVSGMKVYPSEVESVLMEIEGIKDCGVIGIKDEETGEKVVACILSDIEPDKDSILRHCRKKLAAYKIPKMIMRVTAIPKSSIGKTSRQLLKKSLNL